MVVFLFLFYLRRRIYQIRKFFELSHTSISCLYLLDGNEMTSIVFFRFSITMDGIWSRWAMSQINETCQHPIPYLGSDNAEERHLAKWHQFMKGKYARGTLTNEEIEQLSSLPGWTWEKKKDSEFNRKAQTWSRWYALNKKVPSISKSSSKEERNLAQWASRCQKLYSQDKLSPHHSQILNQLEGWRWRSSGKKNHTTFEQRIVEWNEHIQKFNNVPTDGSLYQWYKRMCKMYNENKLSNEKIHQLQDLEHWSWGNVENDFVRSGKRWSSWVRLNEGTFPSSHSTTNPVETKLGQWAEQTKQSIMMNSLPCEIIDNLNRLYAWRAYMES
jgi:hypothetical protein